MDLPCHFCLSKLLNDDLSIMSLISSMVASAKGVVCTLELFPLEKSQNPYFPIMALFTNSLKIRPSPDCAGILKYFAQKLTHLVMLFSNGLALPPTSSPKHRVVPWG